MLDREAAITAIMEQFDPASFDRGNAEMCLAGLREAGFAVVPLDAAEAAGLVTREPPEDDRDPTPY